MPPVVEGNRGVEADDSNFRPNTFMCCPSFPMETPRSILSVLQRGKWLTSRYMKLSILSFIQERKPTVISLSQRHLMAVDRTAIMVVN